MGHLRQVRLGTPIVALLARDPAWIQLARAPLEKLLGPLELESPLYPFIGTDYYAREMGLDLKRQFFTFEPLSDPSALPDWKLATNALEKELKPIIAAQSSALPSSNSSLSSVNALPDRPVNLDPGYMTAAKLVLASTKDFAHRIYMRDGIFAEITMGFRGVSWTARDFTFPDYKSGVYDAFFIKARNQHLQKVICARKDG